IGDVIRGEFKEHGKTVRNEVVEILSGKKDITKPLYLHFAIKRLLHLKRRDFEKCAAGESPEVAVLAEIAAEMPEEVDALLRYSIDNVCANSDISDELHMALALLGGSHGGITEEALISYLIFNGIGHDRSAVMPYVYEIKNRLEDFIVYDGQWLNRRFALELYECYSSDDDTLNNVRRFIDVNRTSYRDEYFVRENMYQNRHDGPGLCDLLSARCLWKAGNAAVRKMYRRCFWNLMADGSITSETIYDRLYMKAAERYKRLYMEADDKDKLEESVEYELPLICDRDLLFRLLAEGFGHELYNYEKGDCAFILLYMLRIYLEELIFIGNSGYLIAVDEVPVPVLDVFEKTAVLYKSISKVLLNANKVSMNCEKIYSLVFDETVNFKEELNALGFGEMLEIHEEDRPVTYLRNSAYMTSALQFFVSLGTFDSRFRAVSNDVVANLFYFNSECLKDKMFETVKYAIVAYITGWANTLDREARRTPADVCSVRYYVDHPRREQLMHGYADALMLTLILLYELYHLEHFADIDGCPDAACGISKTVLDTAMALNQAASGLKWDNSVTLEEKVSIDILKYVLIMTVVKLSLSETQTRQLYSALRVDEFMKIDSLHAAVINPDLNSFLPPHIEEVFDSGADGENAIKNEIIKAVRELNLICL
ncbi:MAG: hypothetical protein J6V14_09065, partial [Clostridia bacterium]|nr:hypothetical protein [Clostridia bacterium]